jgi:DNA-binding transcriptional regulator GbsR (MarR family)
MSKVYEIFGNLISTLGYSKVHGYVLATLFIHKELSLKEIAKKSKYSLPSISLSIDLLELLGLVEKYRKNSSKKIYVKLKGDLLVALKEIILVKINRGICSALKELEKEKSHKVKKVEKEILRLKKYINALNKVEIPKR